MQILKTYYKQRGMKNNNIRISTKIYFRYLLLFIAFTIFSGESAYSQFNALDYQLQKRPANDKFESNKGMENTFLSLSVGAQANFLDMGSIGEYGPSFNYYFGKWINPYIAIRTGLDFSTLYSDIASSHATLGVSADVLANLTTLARGYDKDRLFSLYSIFGATYKRSFRYGFGTSMYGGRFGFQANFNVNPAIDLFIEPKVTLVNDDYNEISISRKYDLLPEVSIGATYKWVDVEERAITKGDVSEFNRGAFISLAGGINRDLTRQSRLELSETLATTFQMSLGYQFTPLHSFRGSIEAGTLKSAVSSSMFSAKGVSIYADYMINYSALFAGYNDKRVFELSGVFGPEISFTDSPTSSLDNISYGFGIGLHGRFRASDCVSVFIEPRLSLHSASYTDDLDNRFDAFGSLVAGVSYARPSDYRCASRDEYKFDSNIEGFFVSSSVGVGAKLSKRYDEGLSGKQILTASGSVSLGKWFSPMSALRFSTSYLSFGTLDSSGGVLRDKSVVFGLDYMLDITTLMCCYNEERIFDFVLGAGASAIYSEAEFSPAIQALAQFKFNINRSWSMYAEPQFFWVFDRGVLLNTISSREAYILAGNVGVQYTMRGYDNASKKEFKREEGKNLFVSFAGGAGVSLETTTLQDFASQISPLGRVNVGRWFSPVGGWRVNMTAGSAKMYQNKIIPYANVGADIMLNISNAATGYKQDRVFTLSAIGGVSVGASLVERETTLIPAITGGVQGLFRVTEGFGLYIEPQISMYFNDFDGYYPQKMLANVLIGAQYTMKGIDGKKSTFRNNSLENKTFVSLSGGAGLYGNTAFSQNAQVSDALMYSGGVSLGRWLTDIHGLRVKFDYMKINTFAVGAPSDAAFGTTRLDYIINLTNPSFGFDKDNVVDFSIFAGAGIAFPFDDKKVSSKAGLTYTAALGTIIDFNVSKNVSIFLEPKAVVYGDEMDGFENRVGFDFSANVDLGLNFKF